MPPDGDPLGERLATLLANPLGRRAATASIAGLPLVELPAAGPGELLAVFWSGDGGWRDLDKQIGEILGRTASPRRRRQPALFLVRQAAGRRSPDDLASIIQTYASALAPAQGRAVGYSFGADILPFTVQPAAAAEQASGQQISLLAPGGYVDRSSSTWRAG